MTERHHQQVDCRIDKRNSEAVLDRLNVPRGHDTADDDSEEQTEGEHLCTTFMCDYDDDAICIIYVRFWRFAVFNNYV